MLASADATAAAAELALQLTPQYLPGRQNTGLATGYVQFYPIELNNRSGSSPKPRSNVLFPGALPLCVCRGRRIYIYTYIIYIYIIDFTCHGFPWMSLQFHQY